MKKARKILAIVGVVLLVLLFLAVLLAAIFDDPETYTYLKISFVAMVTVPILIWLLGMFLRLSQGKGEINMPEEIEVKGEDDGTA
jgi:uncharacterized membrane protein